MMRRNRRMRYRPSKGQCIFAGVMGCAMGLFGLFAIPSFGGTFLAFKAIWVLAAFGMGIYNFLAAAGKVEMGGYDITDDFGSTGGSAPSGASAEERLQELRSLYDRSLITEEEYETKRKEILSEL